MPYSKIQVLVKLFLKNKKVNVKAGKTRTPIPTGTAEVPLLLQTLVVWPERSSQQTDPKGRELLAPGIQGSCPHWDMGLPGEGLAVPHAAT